MTSKHQRKIRDIFQIYFRAPPFLKAIFRSDVVVVVAFIRAVLTQRKALSL